MQAWKSLPSSEQLRLLTENPWDLCKWVTEIEGGDVRGFRHMFLYFCYPNSFERICSRNHKKKIYEAFADKIGASRDAYRIDQSPCGLDKSILELRQVLQTEYKTPELDFYRAPLRDQWLKTDNAPSDERIWVEKTLVKGRPDREAGPNRVGAALWSPQKSSDGRDIYANMREVSPGDVVLHLTDNSGFTGVSVAAAKMDDNFGGVAGTSWGEQPSYRVQLKDFQVLEPPLSRDALFSDNEIRQNLLEILNSSQGHPLFYNKNLELNQGAYLTEAPPELAAVLDGAYEAKTGRHLLPIPITVVEKPKAVAEQFTDRPQRIWLYAPGSKAIYWNEFRSAGIAAIGWDQVGDLKSLTNPHAIKARMDEVYPEPESVVNANQCFDFAHRMRPGDWIFAKKGRREIVGFGVVRSDYRFDHDREYFPNVRDVDWQKAGSWPTAEHRMLSMKTLTEITDDEVLSEELEKLIGLAEQPAPLPLPGTRAPLYSVEDFSAQTAIPEQTIRLWENRLKRKQHMIFQGPPGTGKTFVAELMARLLIGNTFGFSETVQFHPSYSYEDFMQGIRPVVLDGQLIFHRAHGRFLQFCDKARQIRDSSQSPCVLIIDEINRGNLSRVFGELMYLLEYRDKAISLAGEDRPFSIPTNVYIIGTMNTADRSIALVDHALRRRFSFIHLGPDYEVLRRQLESYKLASDGLVNALRAVNSAIEDRNYEVGISFFLKDGAGLRSTLRDIWEGEIEPYLEEYFYDQPGKLEPLRWKKLASGPLAFWATEQ